MANCKWFIPDKFKPWRVLIRLANDTTVYSVGKGSVKFRPKGENRDKQLLNDVIFSNVLFIPDLANNLLSITALSVHHGITFHGRKVFFSAKDELIFSASIDSNLTSYLDEETLVSSLSYSANASFLGLTSSSKVDRSLLHRRMCHLSADRLEQLIQEDLTSDLKVSPSPALPHICKPCLKGKQHRTAFPHKADRAPEVLRRVFSNVYGPMQVDRHRSNRRWWIMFTEDSTRWMEVYDMAWKSDAYAAFKCFKAQVELHMGKKVKCIHFDKGGEYTSSQFMNFCKSEGIRVEFTNTATPQQNSVAERLNRTLEEAITSMLSEANLPQSFWTYALSTYRHVHNRCPTSALPCNLTPFEAYKGRKPHIGHLHVFRCAAYVLINCDKRRGLHGHCVSGVFIGYPDNHVGWKVYVPKTGEILISRDVVFDETCLPGLLRI